MQLGQLDNQYAAQENQSRNQNAMAKYQDEIMRHNTKMQTLQGMIGTGQSLFKDLNTHAMNTQMASLIAPDTNAQTNASQLNSVDLNTSNISTKPLFTTQPSKLSNFNIIKPTTTTYNDFIGPTEFTEPTSSTNSDFVSLFNNEINKNSLLQRTKNSKLPYSYDFGLPGSFDIKRKGGFIRAQDGVKTESKKKSL
jgi:hypothetical protein